MGWLLNLNSPSTTKLSDISLPDRKLSKVVFPDPEGPKMAVKVEGCIKPDCRWSIVFTYFLIFAWILVS